MTRAAATAYPGLEIVTVLSDPRPRYTPRQYQRARRGDTAALAERARSLADFLRLAGRPAEAVAAENLAASIARLGLEAIA